MADVDAASPNSNVVREEERRSVDALTAAGLLEDPESDEGLVFPLPEDAQIVRIVTAYDTRHTSRRKVRCAACKQHQPHHRGFRVALHDGRQVRLGIDCGEKPFGEGAWQAAVADYDRRVEHARYTARVKPALDAIEGIIPLHREWHERTNELARWFGQFRSRFPELHRCLAHQAAVNEGRLERERIRKHKRVNRQGREETYTTIETELVGRIPFPGMFRLATPNNGLNGAYIELGKAVAILNARTDTKSLAKAFQHMQEARRHLQDAADVHHGALANLRTDWLGPMCTWANRDEQMLGGTYSVRGSTLVHDDGFMEVEYEWLDPDQVGEPSIDSIMALWP